jgi:spore germination protein KC
MKLLRVLLCVSLLTGCSGLELNQRGFILGVALDLGQDGQIKLTSQFYKPSITGSGTFVNLRTEGVTLFDAIRDITMKLGRKSQWSHTQTILIGEKMAKSERCRELLDFFYRDDEPRLTTQLIVTEGEAERYLSLQPFMETSISRQVHEIQRAASRYSGKTVQTSLLNLRRQLNSQVETAVIPYMKLAGSSPKEPYVSGAIVINKSGMTGLLTPSEVQTFLMLTEQFKEGIITVPCGSAHKNDSFEVVQLETDMSAKLDEHGVPNIQVNIKITGTIRELVCSTVSTNEAAAAYQKKVAAEVRKELTQSTRTLLDMKADVLGIGNKLYRQNPRQWKQLKPDWNDTFSRSTFAFDVQVVISNTGLEDGTSVFQPKGS